MSSDVFFLVFFNDTATTGTYTSGHTLSLHDALPISNRVAAERESPGSYRPLAPEALYLTEAEWAGATKERPIHIVTPFDVPPAATRSEEHTSELQSLMRISYAVFCLKKKKKH